MTIKFKTLLAVALILMFFNSFLLIFMAFKVVDQRNQIKELQHQIQIYNEPLLNFGAQY